MTRRILVSLAAAACIGASASADPAPIPTATPSSPPSVATAAPSAAPIATPAAATTAMPQATTLPSPEPTPTSTAGDYVLRPDLNNGSWVQGPTLPAPRQNAAVAVLNGRIYLIGGFGSDLRQHDTTYVLQPPLVTSTPLPELQGGPIPSNEGTWQTAAPVPETVDNAAAVGYQGYVYLAGGRIEDKVTNKAWRYDPADDRWDEMRSMPVPRHGATMQAVDGKLYLIGGAVSHGNDDTSIEVFDIQHNSWSLITNQLGTGRIGAATAVIQGKIAVVGGMTRDSRFLTSCDYFDPAHDRWAGASTLRAARADFGLTVVENRLVAIGGIVPGDRPDEDPAPTQTMEVSAGYGSGWINGPWMPFPRQGMAVATLGDVIYLIGGSPWYGVGPIADVRRYVSPLIKVHFGPRTHT